MNWTDAFASARQEMAHWPKWKRDRIRREIRYIHGNTRLQESQTMGEVIEMDTITRLDVPVSRVLKKAKQAELQSVMVIGYDADGNLYCASSHASGPEVLWLLDRARRKLHEVTDDLESES